MPHRFVATHTRFVIIRPARSMKKIGSILLVALAFCLAAPALTAQSDDPSETFLKAYMTSQQGEKLEHENQFKAALVKYRFAGTLLEQLRKAHPDWQPPIVEYRSRKVSEGILRVQDKAGTQESVAGSVETTTESSTTAAPQSSAVPPVQIVKEKAPGPAPAVQIAKEKASAPPPAVAKPVPSATPNEVVIERATK